MLISSTARLGGGFRWHQTSTRITFMSIFTLVVDYSKARGKVSPVCSCQWLTFEVCWMRNVRTRGQREKKLGKSKYLSFTANNLLFGFDWHFFKIWQSQHVFITYVAWHKVLVKWCISPIYRQWCCHCLIFWSQASPTTSTVVCFGRAVDGTDCQHSLKITSMTPWHFHLLQIRSS